MSIRFAVSCAAACALLLVPSLADMGRVYVDTKGVVVSESAQKAIILHNNRREVLILGTEMQAERPTPIVRFIPFPAEPQVSLAPKGVFTHLASIIKKYDLKYVSAWQTKGGPAKIETSGVEVRLAARLGQHDLTVIKVNDVKKFRSWVNGYFKKKHLPTAARYPKEEAVVAEYVKRGIVYFVLDAVELGEKRFIDPLRYEFDAPSLYYPLLTSNTFGGKGDIELYIIAPQSLCAPGSGMFHETDKAVDGKGQHLGNCLGLPVKASTSAELVAQERDLNGIYVGAEAFFGKTPVFLQSIRYSGPYHFDNDVLLPMPAGVASALSGPKTTEDNPFERLLPQEHAQCRMKHDTGPCKAMFERFYFDEKSGICKPFTWGGCQGSVPFETMDECNKLCVMPKN